MTDAHCHLIDSKYKEITPEQIIESAQRENVNLICNGCGVEESKRSIDIAEKYDGVFVCVGLAYEGERINLNNAKKRLTEICQHKKVIGIGEAGLDYYEGMNSDLKKWQESLFRMHLEIAAEHDIPIQIHNRKADADILKAIDEYKIKGVVHCFSGSREYMEECNKRGLYFGIGGLVTFKSCGELRNVVKLIPDDKLLLETDAPYLAPEPIRGTVNRPENVKIVAEWVARIRNTSIEQIEDITDNNVKRLFHI